MRKQELLLCILCLYSFTAITSCKGAKKVAFKTPVDTTTKPIQNQVKKTYELNDLGVYASNEFDAARLNGFKKLNDTTAVVFISPENGPINNSPYYAFKTWSSNPKSFYFKFQYPKGYKHRYIAKIKQDNNWQVIDSSRIFVDDSLVTIKLDLDKKPITVAAQEIQSSSIVKQWYTNLTNNHSKYVTLKTIGRSILGKNLPALDIYNGTTKNKDIIVFITRQHPPEVTGYYAFQSFLNTVLSDSELSKSFLEKYHIIAFPIMNPDGVDLGHWRHNAGGVDTNRDWSQYNQPEIKQAVKFISKSLKKNKAKLVLGLDFHSTWYDVFYTNKKREGTALPNFVNDWFTGLEENIPNYKVNEASGNSTKPVSKGWFLYAHNAVGITYEIGDSTSKSDIEQIGEASANEMMRILLNTKTNY